MPEIRFKLSPELETVLIKEQQTRKQILRRMPPLAALAQEYILKGLSTEGKSIEGTMTGTNTHRAGNHQHPPSLEQQSRQLVQDRLEVLELATKAQAILAENTSLQAEVQTQKRQLERATKRIKQLKHKQATEIETEPPVFLGMTTKELLLVGIPTLFLLVEKYKNGKSHEAKQQLAYFKATLSNLTPAKRQEVMNALSSPAIPWPPKLKEEVFTALTNELGQSSQQ